MKTSILIVDDETDFLDSVVRMLRLEGYDDVTPIANPSEVERLLEDNDHSFDAAFLDVTMPEMDGLDLLKLIKERSPETECVMVTANESIPLVIKAIKRGAYDYLVKPITPDQLCLALSRALERKRLLESLLLRSSRAVKRTLDNPAAFAEIVTGDRRVGKELLARAIHLASRRASGPFVAVNMLALSPALFESEFFGHVKGAFTGADRNKQGYLAQAAGGTLFLDEIGDLSLELQGKLLRILQEGEYAPVGDTRSVRADARFVAATNQDLPKLVGQRKFRKDLFYRLQFAHLQLPPLRQRGDDLTLLGELFLPDASVVTDAAWEALAAHDWPGNVRELRGVLEAATNLCVGGELRPEHLKLPRRPRGRAGAGAKAATAAGAAGAAGATGELEPLADVERRHIIAVYEALGHNKSQAARVLSIGLQTLHRKLKAYGVK